MANVNSKPITPEIEPLVNKSDNPTLDLDISDVSLLKPTDNEVVGEGDLVDDSESVGNPSFIDIVCVLLIIIVTVPLTPLGDLLGVFDELGVIEGEVPFDNDDVGEAVTVVELVAVLDNETVGVVLDVTVPELDEEAVGVREEDDVIDIVTLSVLLGDIGALGLMLALVQ